MALRDKGQSTTNIAAAFYLTPQILKQRFKLASVALDLPYGYSHALRRLARDPEPMTDAESTAHARLLAQYRALEEEYAGRDELNDEIDTRLGALAAAIEKIEAQPLIFDPAEVARAGTFVTLDRYGALAIYRGYVSPLRRPQSRTALRGHPHPPPARAGIFYLGLRLRFHPGATCPLAHSGSAELNLQNDDRTD